MAEFENTPAHQVVGQAGMDLKTGDLLTIGKEDGRYYAINMEIPKSAAECPGGEEEFQTIQAEEKRKGIRICHKFGGPCLGGCGLGECFKGEPEIPLDPVIEAVRADLLRRQQHGYVKYGGTLATNPAGYRDKLQHAYEEALDLANYLKWAMMELDRDPELKPDPTHNTGIR